MPKLGVKFVVKFVSGVSGAGTLGTTALNHKIGYDPVKLQTIVIGFSLRLYGIGEAAFRQAHKVPHGTRGFVVGQLDQDAAFRCIEFCVDAFFHFL
jgi:hypothetical protein